MRITNCGRGIHKREVKGIDRFRNELPSDWFGYTNIDLVIGLGQPREVDLVIVSPKRIFLIDLKDWNGRIETVNGHWFQNGKDHGPSSTSLPEDVLGEDKGPKRRDVFLLGVAIYLLLFGTKPDGNPPEWHADIDRDSEYVQLHDWFAEALEMDPSQRFPDAVKAHEAFLRATATRPTPDEVISGLEQFRGEIRSQRQLASAFPMEGDPIKESDRVDVWRSKLDSREVVVKLWKQAAWGDTRREGATILSFLNRAADQKADRPLGLSCERQKRGRKAVTTSSSALSA